MRVLILSCVLPLSACGFQLAGTRPLPQPLQRLHVEVVLPYSVREPPLAAAFRDRINRRGGSLAASAGEAAATLRLTQLVEDRAVLSVGPDSKAVELRLTTSVAYQLNSGRRQWLEPDVLSVTRDYSFTAQQVLSKEAEEERLRAFMQEELAELLMLRLESQLRALQSLDAPAPPVGVVPVP